MAEEAKQAEEKVLSVAELPAGSKRVVTVSGQEILLISVAGLKGSDPDTFYAVQAKCPHAGGPLEQGAICNGRLVCPWHMGTFLLESGTVVEPPPLQGLRHYRVRAEGGSIFVDPTPVSAAPPAPGRAGAAAEQHLLCIGAGAATAAAVSHLEQAGFRGRITVVDPVPDEPVDRTQLSKMALSGKKPLDTVPLWPGDKKPGPHVERIAGRVQALSARDRTARLEDGAKLTFDAALLAVGGAPRPLQIPGAELPHVHTIRHTPDVVAILQQVGKGTEVVVLGGSFIALEAASALTQGGSSVTVVCREKLPFAKRFGEAPAQALVALHRSKGVRFHLEAEAASIDKDSVLLKSGERLPAAVVIVGIGVRPATDFKHDLPTEEDGSIQVAGDLRAAGSVWVAGDIASVNGTRIEHWRLAEQHGVVAARGMLGETTSYDGVPFFWTFHFGKRLGYLGHAEKWDSIEIEGDVNALEFLAFYLQGQQVAAVLSCGRDTETAMLAEIMRQKPTLAQAKAAVAAVAAQK